MILQDNFFVDKSTGTSADALEAFGLASLLNSMVQGSNSSEPVEVTIHDEESCYRIELERPLRTEEVDEARYQALHNYVRVGKKRPADETIPVDDLDAEYEKIRLRREMREAAAPKAKGKRTAEQQQLGEEQRQRQEELNLHKLFPIWDAMQHTKLKAHDTYSEGVRRWHQSRIYYPDLLRVILLRYSASPNLVIESEQAWKELTQRHNIKGADASPEMSAVQMYNPGMGKGVNKDKPNGVSKSGRGNFWPVEYLKHEGLYLAGITLPIGDDRKTYVLSPKRIDLSTHNAVFSNFRDQIRWVDHPFKADILASLTYTIAFLDYSGTTKDEQAWFGSAPSQAVAGFGSTLYKSMGQAAAVMNLSFIGLPVWVQPNSAGEVQPYKVVLKEHEQVIEQLGRGGDGRFMGRSDQLDLLREYRDFISGNNLQAFFQFAVGYSQYLTQAIENGWRYKMFSISNLERMISMSERELQEIIDDPGFLRVAAAMRNSTVTLQRRKAQGQSPDYDIRYGLGLELNRAMNKRDTFVQALSEFVFKYNAETAQVQESSKNQKRRKTVSVDDLNAIVRLIDKFDFKTVGSLLIAYGYASAGEAKPVGGSDGAGQDAEVDSNEADSD